MQRQRMTSDCTKNETIESVNFYGVFDMLHTVHTSKQILQLGTLHLNIFMTWLTCLESLPNVFNTIDIFRSKQIV